jgi:uncharacterized cupredoxin-like copper-binding protein
LPLAVTLKRFLAPDFVFNFGIFHAERCKQPRPLGSVTNRHGMPWARRLFKSGRRYGKTAANATAGLAMASPMRLAWALWKKGRCHMSGFKIGVAAFIASMGLAAGAALAQPSGATVVTVQLSEYKFSPAEIDLDHGRSYILRVVNTGGKAHDLSAKAFFQTVSVAADSAGEVKDGEVELAMGESADVALVPNRPGTYEMRCTHPLHAMLGMKGKIVVR